MIRQRTQDFDNRDANQMYEYLEARIEALKRRVSELERENESLTFELVAGQCIERRQLAASA
jgi:cell division protein FtsB